MMHSKVMAIARPTMERAQALNTSDTDALLRQYILRDIAEAVASVEEVLHRESSDMPLDARKSLARDLVIGAWLNRDNPEWDPTQPSTHKPIPNDPLLAILSCASQENQEDIAAT